MSTSTGRPGPPRASTLHDVAARVGVSPRTVSRVVNDEGGFSEATRQRVLDAIGELDYRPNALARALITRRSGTISFIVPWLNDPFFPEVAEGVQRAAQSAGLTVLMAVTSADRSIQTDVLSSLETQKPDGVIIFPAAEDASALRSFLDRGLPMVLVDTHIDHPNAAVVASDLASGARAAVDRFVETGRTRLAMLTHSASEHRRRETAFRESPATGADPIVAPVAATMAGGRSGMRRLLEAHPDIDAVFAFNDLMAIGAVQALREAGRSVPDDVAVIGCDDIAMGSVVTPALTTIRIDGERLGQEAVRLVADLADGKPPGPPTILSVDLVVRESA